MNKRNIETKQPQFMVWLTNYWNEKVYPIMMRMSEFYYIVIIKCLIAFKTYYRHIKGEQLSQKSISSDYNILLENGLLIGDKDDSNEDCCESCDRRMNGEKVLQKIIMNSHNNKILSTGAYQIDIHGLHLNDLDVLVAAIRKWMTYTNKITIITGRGKHSRNSTPVLQGSLEGRLREIDGLKVYVNRPNIGCITIAGNNKNVQEN